MKALSLIFCVAISAFSVSASATDVSACYNIADQDARNMCRAKAHNDSSICYAIQRQDIKSQCLADTRK